MTFHDFAGRVVTLTSNLWPLRLGEEKKDRRRNKPQGKNIMAYNNAVSVVCG